MVALEEKREEREPNPGGSRGSQSLGEELEIRSENPLLHGSSSKSSLPFSLLFSL